MVAGARCSDPSAARGTMAPVFVARLICSDVECAAEHTAESVSAAELETLLCDCGCAFEVIGWPDWIEEPAEVVALTVRSPALRDAA
jgi:hypothetical protein